MDISNIFYIKKMNNVNYLFGFTTEPRNSQSEFDKFADENNLNYCYDGFEWIYENKRYELQFKYNDLASTNIVVHNNKIFICYNGVSPSFPAPNNLVIYKPTGEIEKVLSTPILPTGKQGAGFMQIGDLKGWETVPKGFEDWLSVWVWEHQRSEWVYQYFFNPDTYEFVFGHKFRN